MDIRRFRIIKPVTVAHQKTDGKKQRTMNKRVLYIKYVPGYNLVLQYFKSTMNSQIISILSNINGKHEYFNAISTIIIMLTNIFSVITTKPPCSTNVTAPEGRHLDIHRSENLTYPVSVVFSSSNKTKQTTTPTINGLHGCETWVMISTDKSRLQTTEV
jgi:hypothetical protein